MKKPGIKPGFSLNFLQSDFSGCVPDRACVGTLLMAQWYVRVHLGPKKCHIIGLPGRRRDFQYTCVVNGRGLRIKIRIGPYRTQFRVTDVVQVSSFLLIHRIAYRCPAPSIGINRAAIGDGYVIDFLICPLVRRPGFEYHSHGLKCYSLNTKGA